MSYIDFDRNDLFPLCCAITMTDITCNTPVEPVSECGHWNCSTPAHGAQYIVKASFRTRACSPS